MGSVRTVCRGSYDVDLLYNKDNFSYVSKYFIPVLEQQLGLHICLPERDHMAGVPIADNIINSSKNSRYCIILFCRKFYEAEWNSFASYVALHGSLIQKSFRVIPVIISAQCRVDSKFKQYHHLDITEEAKRRYFWRKLCQSLDIPHRKANGLEVPPTIEQYNYRQMSLQGTSGNNDPPGGPPSLAYPLPDTQPPEEFTEQNSTVSSSYSGATSTQGLSEQDLNILKMFISFVICIFAWKILNNLF